jgi:cysteine desulfurase
VTSVRPLQTVHVVLAVSVVIYLDYHATTPVDPRVTAEMLPWLGERFGNAASIGHAIGRAAGEAVAVARGEIAETLGCTPEELVFTSGATEANNLALKGVMQTVGRGAHVVTSAAEHRSVLDPARRLRREGCTVTIAPVDQHGRVDPQRIVDSLQPGTRLVSVMLANNEVGTLNPIREIGELCRARGILLHCDAAQAIGKVPLDLRTTPVDLLTFTAHKLCGPQGIGALYARKTDPAIPLIAQIDGGGHERGLRSGTLPVALIAGFAAAVRVATVERESEVARLTVLRERLRASLLTEINDAVIHGHPSDHLPGNMNVGFPGVDGDALLVGVAERGLCVSSGSACTSANPEPSHVLRAMGVPDTLARASLRFGLGRFTTADEVDAAVEIVSDVVKKLRKSKTE